MVSVIRYRHYRHDEAGRFFGNRLFYSRSSHFRGNCPGLPDTIQVAVESVADSPCIRHITVTISLNQTGRTGELTQTMGFRKATGGLYQKTVQLKVIEGCRTIDILAKLHPALDKIVGELPIMLYATAHAKQVREYTDFMQSDIPKLRQWELADFENLAQRAVKHDITRFGLIDNHGISDFCVMRLPKGNWVTWIEGDELIPVLPDELQAYRFMKDRLMPYEGFRREAYEEFAATRLGT